LSNPSGTIPILLRILPYAKKALPRLLLGVIAAISAAAVALSIPQVLRELINSLSSSGTIETLHSLVLLVFAMGLLEVFLVLLRRWLVLTPVTGVESDMRTNLFRKLQDLPISFHDRWPSGQLLSRATQDLGLIRRWLSFGLVLLIANAVTIVIGLTVLFSFSWILGLIFFVVSVPIWIKGFRFESGYGKIARQSQDQAGDLATAVEESVHGIRVLKAFGRGDHSAEVFAKGAVDLRSTELQKAGLIANVWAYLLFLPETALALSMFAGILLVADGSLTVGGLVAFFATATVLRWPTESIGFLLALTLDAKTAIQRHYDVMDEPVLIQDPLSPSRISNPVGKLEFKHVHFSYPDQSPEFMGLLRGIDLVLSPGQSVALIGVTGSGKTTLTSLTTRLFEVSKGSIELDGVDIRNLSLAELRTHIAMAFEDATLFSASVRDNVLLGAPDKTDAALNEALEIAQAGFVYDLPDGVETKIGEEGLSLSGGQRQRLALARAVAAKPSVLVLDDPLSALDVDTEALVESALRTVLTKTTALIVAHRPSTVQLADRVALLQDGKIVAFGTHTQLLQSSEHYRYVVSSLETSAGEVIA
jgi:ATP-binding cassette subfamily B protein